MAWSWRTERAYWSGESPRLWRRGWWMLLVLAMLATFGSVPVIGQLVNWLAVAMVAVVVVRRVVAGRDLEGVLHRRWKEGVSKSLTAMWPNLARNLRLEVRNLAGVPVVTGAGRPSWHGWTCYLPVSMPPGLAREDLVAATGRIQQAFNAVRVSVVGEHLTALALRVDYADALAQRFTLPLGGDYDGRSVLTGITEDGQQWRLPLGPHTLVAGCSGSGKASLVWGLLLGLAQPIHAGHIEVWGIDRKGGMELAMGRALLTRFADDAATSVALLDDAVAAMQARARALAGITRQHTPTAESPTVIVLIDELAALTSYETDREMLRRANAAIATLASQGRAVGFILFACLQDPRKETLPARGLFTQTVGLRLRDRTETAMVLGDGAVAAGGLCHEISASTPGVAYVLSENGGTPLRVPAAFAPDEQIRDAAATYFAPHPVEVLVPPPPEPASRPSRRRQTRRASTTDTPTEES